MPSTAIKPKPRTKPAEIRRNELMAAAEALFLEKGFAATSVDEIVRLADVAKGTFYLHFRSKDDMLIALRQRFIDRFCEGLEQQLEQCPVDDWQGKLAVWAETGIAGYLDNYKLHDMVFHDFHPPMRRMKQENPAIIRLDALLTDGNAAGAWKIADTRLTAVLLFNALHGAVDEIISNPDMMDRVEMVAGVKAFFLQAVRA
ncbi:TetR/AcrR family transcriptional regulator [Ochrobactrum oryzae]|uniref:TetR/AcrR family transcriptional regulator n=1 Tax=Brucella oryzae TaxID=335286 RepID=A0A2S7IYP8_9HYPH|nr:TetR/AcrR family transcriptional regulator [Brucella oryzae]MBR7651013.1 TetR/AcrR family transcriptional regulator [Brucella oryzae]NKC22477.1 TetR/AcrR family transcriptional regulator [Brucella oryzae]PQA73066.1 TetR/AcrR family transcriptional regulator [Brucella oryzae]